MVVLSFLVCPMCGECTWGPVTVGYCCIICLTVTVWQTWQVLTLSCSVHSSCHRVSHSVLYCPLFAPAVWRSATNPCTEVWSGSCKRSCQKQEHCRVPTATTHWCYASTTSSYPTGTKDALPASSWWYTSTTHSRWEEKVQSWKRSVWLSIHWALSSWWVVHSQSSHAVSALCQSFPQSVVPEKQPLPLQLAVQVGWTNSLLCVYRAPRVDGGRLSNLTILNCSAAILTWVSCAAPSVHVPPPPLLPECCSAVS